MDNPRKPNNPRRPGPQASQENRFANTALLLGIFSIFSITMMPITSTTFGTLGMCTPYICGVFGIASAILSRQNKRMPGPSVAGIVLSVCGITMNILMVFAAVQIYNTPDFTHQLQQLFETLTESSPAQGQ